MCEQPLVSNIDWVPILLLGYKKRPTEKAIKKRRRNEARSLSLSAYSGIIAFCIKGIHFEFLGNRNLLCHVSVSRVHV